MSISPRLSSLLVLVAAACQRPTPMRPPAPPALEAATQVRDAGPPATGRRRQEWHDFYDLMSAAMPGCGGYRTGQYQGRTSIVLPAGCFFEAGGTALHAASVRAVATVAAAMRDAPRRHYLVGVHAAEPDARDGDAAPSDPGHWWLTAAQAASLVQALTARGVAPERLAAAGLGDHPTEEVYDGPATLAPGQALVEIVIEPGPDEVPAVVW